MKTSDLTFALKDAMDRIGAAVALVFFSPLFLYLIWKVTRDGGPAFFGHVRIGYKGRPFKCWKFRSMAVNSGEMLQNLLDTDPAAKAEWESTYKLKDDPRITKIGAFLRKTSLDELPQFYNVLVGEMSLVGPRPIVEDERRFYGEKMSVYNATKPGITGLWQVSGRNDVSYDERISLDEKYVLSLSLWNDIMIMFRTVGIVMARKGAY